MNSRKEKREVPKGRIGGTNGIEFGIYIVDKVNWNKGKYMTITPYRIKYFKSYDVAKKLFDKWMNK